MCVCECPGDWYVLIASHCDNLSCNLYTRALSVSYVTTWFQTATSTLVSLVSSLMFIHFDKECVQQVHHVAGLYCTQVTM